MMTKLHYSQSYLGILLCSVLLASLNLSLSPSDLLIVLALAVILLGLPHGALDFAVAKSLKLVGSSTAALFFIATYVLVSALAIALWIAFPVFGLAVFLTISIYHFSGDWRDIMPRYASLGLAAVVVCGSAIFYSKTLLMLFTSLLLTPEHAEQVIQGMTLVFGIGILLLLFFVGDALRHKTLIGKWMGAEWLGLVASSLILSPLLHFALYFCLLHSPKHLHDVSRALDVSVRQSIIISLPFVLLTLLLAVVLFKFVGTEALNTTLLREIFIGLFGLTMSHMLLIDLWHGSQR